MTNMYCALYRKYRPDKLDDIVGQNVIVRTLKNSILNEHISHAYLFTGPRGTGKTSIAKILAKTINCTDIKGIVPCNKCVSCTQINNKQNVDIIEIDAASNNGVDEIREIKNKVNLVPSISKYKIYIIDEVHMLTTGAFNALLKTLEEPPSHIIFILATTEPHKIPITILSRCQRFDFKRISVEDILKRLEFICKNENIEISEDAIKQIAITSDGGMRDAIGMLDQVISYAENKITINDVHDICGTISKDELSDLISLLLDGNLEKLLLTIDCYYGNGKNLSKISEELVIFLKNILLYKRTQNYFINSHIDYQPYVKFSNISSEKIISIIDMFTVKINELKQSSSPKLIFELIIISIVSLTNNKYLQNEKESSLNKPNTNTNMKIIDVPNTNADENIIKLQTQRISNTLSKFSKQTTIKLKSKLSGLNNLLIDPKISQVVSMILDGELKAASDEYVIFTFETENSTKTFNDNLCEIEKVLYNLFEFNYRAIGVINSEWTIIKKDFNTKSKIFKYIREDSISLKTKKIDTNDIENLFGNVVEYES